MIDPSKKYWNMDVELRLNTPEIRETQLKMLPRAIRYCYENVPFERRRLDAAGVKPGDIRTFEDFQRAFKPVGQAEFRKVYEEFDLDMDKVWLHLFGKDRMDDLFLLTTTSGTTGVPTPYPVFHKTTDTMAELLAASDGAPGCGRATSWPCASASACMPPGRRTCSGTSAATASP